MTIMGKVDKSTLHCEVRTQGKFIQTRNREPDVRAKAALDLVHTDLVEPIDPESREGYRFALSFTDDYSSAVFVYFLKSKQQRSFLLTQPHMGRLNVLGLTMVQNSWGRITRHYLEEMELGMKPQCHTHDEPCSTWLGVCL